jgi:hypothetical protein
MPTKKNRAEFMRRYRADTQGWVTQQQNSSKNNRAALFRRR